MSIDIACGQRTAGEHQQFQRVVENCRVAGAGHADRANLFQIRAVDRMRQHALAGVHPVDVAAQRVDFAVVRQEAERMGQVPGRKRVRAVALMHQGQRRDEPLVGQVGIEPLDLIGQQQALVDDHARRQRADIAVLLLLQILCCANFQFVPLANDVQLPLEHVGRRLGAAGDERLANDRLDVAGGAADDGVVDRHVAPAEKLLAFLGADCFEPLVRSSGVRLRSGGKKHVADAVIARRRQLDAQLRQLGAKNSCGICVKMPAPSPVSGSQPQAPRCVRFTRISRPGRTI